MRVAVLTCQGLPRFVTWEIPDVDALFTDDRMLIAAFQQRGVVAEQVVWSDPAVDWNSYDVALIRSTWDYIDDRELFLSVLTAIESSSCRLHNAADAVRWNSDKSYLFDLEAWGIPIVPTLRATTFMADAPGLGWSSVVLKPTVGTGASGISRLAAGEVGTAIERVAGEVESYLVQPMVDSVVTEGEWSFVFIAGEFSHALLKKPGAGDYRTQGIYGGSVRFETAAADDIRQAEAILSALPYELLYARLDLVRVDGRLAAMELELIEPILYFDLAPGQVDRLAAATIERVRANPVARDYRLGPTKRSTPGMNSSLITPPVGQPKPWPKSQVPKASTLLANNLRDEIIRGRLAVGTNLPGEVELIEKTGYSRATVREAMRLLESEGLIVTRRGPHGGVKVSAPDIAQSTRSIAVLLALSDAKLRDLFRFRRDMEPEVARLAASAATPEQVEALLRATDQSAEPLERLVSFHELVAEACGNEFYRVMVKVIVEIAAWHTPEEGLVPIDMKIAHSSHRKVVEHIAAGRGDEAAAEMAAHLKSFEAVVESHGNLDLPVLRPQHWPLTGTR